MAEYQIRYAIVQHRDDDDTLLTEEDAARLTGLSVAAVRQCCDEGLVRPVATADDSLAFDAAGLRRLSRIARLQTDLELDMAAVEIVLHLRDQMRDVQRQMAVLRRLHQQREEELLATIRDLRRRFATDGLWRE